VEIMKITRTVAVGVAAVLGLGYATVSALAHPGGQGAMGWGQGHHTGRGAMGGGMGYGMMGGGGGYPAMAAYGAGCYGTGPAGAGAGRGHPMGAWGYLSAEEQQAFREQMQNATTPEQRREVAAAHRSTIEQRAREQGVTLPYAYGHMMGYGRGVRGGAAIPNTDAK
jgi:hypothetical protein